MRSWEHNMMKNASTKSGWALVHDFAQLHRCMPDEVHNGAKNIMKYLDSLSIDYQVFYPQIYLGIPICAEITLGNQRIIGKATALSPSVNSLRAKLCYLPANKKLGRKHSGNPSDLFDVQFDSLASLQHSVEGKIVITEGLSNPARTEMLQKWGAVAVIVINPGDKSHWGTNSSVWGSPTEQQLDSLPKIASVAVSNDQGQQVLQAYHENMTVEMTVDMRHGWFEQPVIVAEVKGADNSDDFVMLHSHYDSWEVGVGDNATGNAVVLEVANVINRSDTKLKRHTRFAWWPGHSAGRYAGSSWYAEAFGIDVYNNCIAHVNCDSPGCKDATSYHSIRSMQEATPLVQTAVWDLFEQQCITEKPGRVGDYSFNNLGISGCMLTSSMVPKQERKKRGWYDVGGCGGNPVWHNEQDTLEVADENVMLNDIKLYALIVSRLANEDIIPLDLRIPMGHIEQQIVQDLQKVTAVLDVAPLQHTLSKTVKSVNDFYQKCHAIPTITYNQALKKMSRKIVRLGYCIGTEFTQDPAKALDFVPLLSPLRHLNGQGTGGEKITVQRAVNAVHQTLIDITDIIHNTTNT